jgi:hypothetical protein
MTFSVNDTLGASQSIGRCGRPFFGKRLVNHGFRNIEVISLAKIRTCRRGSGSERNAVIHSRSRNITSRPLPATAWLTTWMSKSALPSSDEYTAWTATPATRAMPTIVVAA